MYQNRIIPCLLLHDKGLVKTVKFKDPTYLGDPFNTLRLFNEKEVDELILLDIDATRYKREPDYGLIEDLASECFMPLCYGGGVTTLEQMKRIFASGVEKIALSAAAVTNSTLIKDAVRIFGSQSIVVVIDVKKSLLGQYHVYTDNGTKNTKLNVLEWVQEVIALGAGEIVINAIDRDGMMKGYDIPLIKEITGKVDIPVIALGGAGSIEDLREVIYHAGASAAAAGSLFVFSGVHKAVLINYPTREVIDTIIQREPS